MEEQSVRYIQVFKQRGSSAGELGSGPEYAIVDEELVSAGEDSLPGEVIGAMVVDMAYDFVRVVILPLLVSVSQVVL